MAHLEYVTLIVRDYDPAIRFFVDLLQFELIEDVPSLAAARRNGFFLRVEEFAATHARLVAADVEFLTTPHLEPYGMVAVFRDLEGNRWDLLGPPADT